MAEWLTREIRNLFLSEGAGSNPAGVVLDFSQFLFLWMNWSGKDDLWARAGHRDTAKRAPMLLVRRVVSPRSRQRANGWVRDCLKRRIERLRGNCRMSKSTVPFAKMSLLHKLNGNHALFLVP